MRKEVPGAGAAAAAVAEELEGPLVKNGREAQEVSVVTPLPAGSGPSLEPLGLGQWLPHLSEGRVASPLPQNLLGAEYAETTERSEEDRRRPVSTSVSCAPSKSSMARRPGGLCPGSPVFENHCGRAEEPGEGSPVGKQNKDLLLWKDQGRLGGLLARLANSCRCPGGRPAGPGPGCDLPGRGCRLPPGALLGAAEARGGGAGGGFCSAEA